jgi:hypothetical protein
MVLEVPAMSTDTYTMAGETYGWEEIPPTAWETDHSDTETHDSK